MKPILFEIGNFKVYGYGLMYALSLIVGLLLAEYRAKKNGLDKDFAFNLGLFSIIFGVLGAKLFHLFTVMDQLTKDFWGTLKDSLSEGFVVYGGIVVAALFAILYTRHKKVKFLPYFDIAVASIALGQAIGRIGCLLAGCCYGIETDAWYAITFPKGCGAPAGVGLFPAQPLGSILNLINFFILLYAYKKFKTTGRTGALYMINYGVGRFVIEFFRNDPRGNVGVLSTSQFISIFFIVGGILLMIFAPKLTKVKEETNEEIEINDESREEA